MYEIFGRWKLKSFCASISDIDLGAWHGTEIFFCGQTAHFDCGNSLGLHGSFCEAAQRNGADFVGYCFSPCLAHFRFYAILIFIKDKNLFKIKLRDLWCFAGTGLLSIVFFNLCYFKEITITSLSVAAILLYTAP